MDMNGKDIQGWKFQDALPIKWSGTEFKSDGNAVVFESLEFVHRGFKPTS